MTARSRPALPLSIERDPTVLSPLSAVDLRALTHELVNGALTIRERLAYARVDATSAPVDPRAAAAIEHWCAELGRLGAWPRVAGQLGLDASAQAPDRLRRASRTVSVSSDAPLAVMARELVGHDEAPSPDGTDTPPEDGLPPLPPAVVAYARRRLRASVDRAGPAVGAHASLDALLAVEESALLELLHAVLLPVLTTELHVAVERDVLAGATPAERFREFCEHTQHAPEWLAEVLVAYPGAWRAAHELVERNAAAFVELLLRFHADRATLVAEGLIDDSSLAWVSPPSGDRHRDGRCVRILRTAGGRQCVYKPRSVALDRSFQDLLAWLNARGLAHPLYVMRVVVREKYGWFEHIPHRPCDDPDAVARFYWRQGAHLALLYLLGGNDFFAENVRAQGEYPVLLDLECLLAPTLPSVGEPLFESAGRRYQRESVERSGMIPVWSWRSQGGAGINLSALTKIDGQLSPNEVVTWRGTGSDELRQERQRRPLFVSHAHLPVLADEEVPVTAFKAHLYAGFDAAYALLHEHRDILSDASYGPLASFARAHVRVLLRNTVDYDALLHASYHPRHAAHGARGDLLFDHLYLARAPLFADAVVEEEIRQLRRGDVPILLAQADSRALRNDRGAVVVDSYFTETAWEGIVRRLARLGAKDRRHQRDILESSFAIAEVPNASSDVCVLQRGTPPCDADHPTHDAMVAEARALADHLLDEAIEDEQSITWLGLGLGGDSQWQPMSLDSSLYDGGHGIALFLLMLSRVTGEGRYADAARKVMQYAGVDPARRVLAKPSWLSGPAPRVPGAFEFPFSALYLAAHGSAAGVSVDVEPLVAVSLRASEAALRGAPEADFLAGSAGHIRMLLLVHSLTGDPSALRLARRHGERLVSTAVRLPTGWGWMSSPFTRPLGGFSHGTSGIAFALAELADATGDADMLVAAGEALRYDRWLFAAGRPTWRDARVLDDDVPGDAVQWCHGVAGIGLSRVLMARITGDAVLLDDALHAADLLRGSGEMSDCLCHGTVGNLDVCQTILEASGQARVADIMREKLSALWRTTRRRGGWRTGLPKYNIGFHGLFVGTAGIGYGLLRLAAPERVPSVLWLESPRTAS